MLRKQFSSSVRYRQQYANQSLSKALLHSFVVRGWKAGIALLTALSFVLLISTAATHHHANSVEDQSCSLCSAVSNKLDHVTPTALAIVTLHVLVYKLFTSKEDVSDFALPTLLPPSCGPPAIA